MSQQTEIDYVFPLRDPPPSDLNDRLVRWVRSRYPNAVIEPDEGDDFFAYPTQADQDSWNAGQADAPMLHFLPRPKDRQLTVVTHGELGLEEALRALTLELLSAP